MGKHHRRRLMLPQSPDRIGSTAACRLPAVLFRFTDHVSLVLTTPIAATSQMPTPESQCPNATLCTLCNRGAASLVGVPPIHSRFWRQSPRITHPRCGYALPWSLIPDCCRAACCDARQLRASLALPMLLDTPGPKHQNTRRLDQPIIRNLCQLFQPCIWQKFCHSMRELLLCYYPNDTRLALSFYSPRPRYLRYCKLLPWTGTACPEPSWTSLSHSLDPSLPSTSQLPTGMQR
jgi:hypothetical protein